MSLPASIALRVERATTGDRPGHQPVGALELIRDFPCRAQQHHPDINQQPPKGAAPRQPIYRPVHRLICHLVHRASLTELMLNPLTRKAGSAVSVK